MDDKELRKHLEELHNEIEHAESIEEKGRELLRDVKNDIRELLERSGSGPCQPGRSRWNASKKPSPSLKPVTRPLQGH